MLYIRLVLILWSVFIVYWALSAARAKRNIGPRGRWRTAALMRLGMLVFVVLVVRIPVLYRGLRRAQSYTLGDTQIRIVGVVLCALGIGLAIWARVKLGRNWGMPMSRKENPELVTAGPYASIRHPIYTGMLIAMLGSAISTTVVWLVPLVVFAVYFVYGARREEKLMLETFPEQYPAYMRRTKMLVPFVL